MDEHELSPAASSIEMRLDVLIKELRGLRDDLRAVAPRGDAQRPRSNLKEEGLQHDDKDKGDMSGLPVKRGGGRARRNS